MSPFEKTFVTLAKSTRAVELSHKPSSLGKAVCSNVTDEYAFLFLQNSH